MAKGKAKRLDPYEMFLQERQRRWKDSSPKSVLKAQERQVGITSMAAETGKDYVEITAEFTERYQPHRNAAGELPLHYELVLQQARRVTDAGVVLLENIASTKVDQPRR